MKKIVLITILVLLVSSTAVLAEISDVTGFKIPDQVSQNQKRYESLSKDSDGPTSRGYQEWTGDGPWGGIVRGIASSSGDNSKVISVCGHSMADNGGVWRSDDGGQTWTDCGLDHDAFYGLAASHINDGVFYAGGDPGFFKTTDYGETWEMLSMGSSFVLKIGVKYDNDDVILIGLSSSGGVRRSTDGGETWNEVGINSGFLKGVAVTPDNPDKFVIAGSDFPSSAMQSLDGGETWTEIGPTPQGEYDAGYDVLISPDDENQILLLHDDGIYGTVDNGLNWNLLKSGGGQGEFAVYGGDIYVGIWGEGAFVSSDNGMTWNEIPDAGVENYWQASGSGSQGVLLGYWGGINRSSDGENWEFSAQGMSGVFTHALAYYEDENELWAGTEGGGIFCSSDGGQTWERKCEGLNSLWIYDFAPTSHYNHSVNRMLAATASGLYSSDDNGDSWNYVDMEGTTLTDVEIHWTDEDQFWEAGQMGPVKYTSDNGQTWITATGLPFGLYPKLALGENADEDLRVFLCYENGYGTSVYYSDDNGATFSEGSGMTGISYHPMLSVRLADEEYDQIVYCATGQGLYRSDDYGENWSQVSGTSGLYWSVLGTRGEQIFLGSNNGVQYSDDEGQTWADLNNGIAGIAVWRILYGNSSNQVYAANRGEPVLEYHFEEVLVPPTNVQVDSLIGNNPNPFTNTTNIQFSLKQPGKVELDIYNIRGEKVKSISNEYPAGCHSCHWDGKNENGKPVSNGIYFYRMKTNEYKQTRKMMLIR